MCLRCMCRMATGPLFELIMFGHTWCRSPVHGATQQRIKQNERDSLPARTPNTPKLSEVGQRNEEHQDCAIDVSSTGANAIAISLSSDIVLATA